MDQTGGWVCAKCGHEAGNKEQLCISGDYLVCKACYDLATGQLSDATRAWVAGGCQPTRRAMQRVRRRWIAMGTVFGVGALLGISVWMISKATSQENNRRVLQTAQTVAPETKVRSEPRKSPPFKYKVIKVKEMTDYLGPGVMVDLETTNEVARTTSKNDLHKLWEYIGPTLGDRRVFVSLRTPVLGASPWAVISRMNTYEGGWRVNTIVDERGIDAQPFYFVDKIDRSVQYQRDMIVTLPMVNRLNEDLVRRGWKVTMRTENLFRAKPGEWGGAISVTLEPDGVNIDASRMEGNTFIDTVDLVFNELGIAKQVKDNLYSAIGSPSYVLAAPGKPATWSWTIGNIDVEYTHWPEPETDSIIAYAHHR